MRVSLSSGETIVSTPEHLFSKAGGDWVRADSLKIGDRLATNDDRVLEIQDVQSECASDTVFSIEVAGTFTYFVEGVWVHNRSCPVPNRHHLYPQQFREYFNRVPGLDMDHPSNLLPLQPDWHHWLHGSKNGFNWNGKWQMFIRRNPNPSLKKVSEFMDQMKRQPGDAFEKAFGQ